MIEKKLKQIAFNENGKYSLNEYKRVFADGSRSPEDKHVILFSYKDCTIRIFIAVGIANRSIITATLPPNKTVPDFEIQSISHFVNLFLRRKSRCKVKCIDTNFKLFLEKKALSVFNHVMKAKNFSPTIFTQKKESKQQIIMEFHLAFPDWVDAFEDVIVFYKMVIDKLKSI